jgi:hypothetical protein
MSPWSRFVLLVFVTSLSLSLSSKLFLHLPHTVNDQGRAKWDPRTETLSIELPIVRRHDED